MWVLKLGGSLLEAGQLEPWLRALPALAGSGLVVVPGGGPFADGVRRWQRHAGASDLTAHRQALLAMQQMACWYLERCPAARPWRFEIEGRAGIAPGTPWVWLPDPHGPLSHGLKPDWRTTSDSLSLLLAARLGAQGLLLAKARGPVAAVLQALTPAELDAELVDAAFAPLWQRLPIPVWWLGPEATDAARALIERVSCRCG